MYYCRSWTSHPRPAAAQDEDGLAAAVQEEDGPPAAAQDKDGPPPVA